MANIATAGSADTRTTQQKYLDSIAKNLPDLKQLDGTSATAKALAGSTADVLSPLKQAVLSNPDIVKANNLTVPVVGGTGGDTGDGKGGGTDTGGGTGGLTGGMTYTPPTSTKAQDNSGMIKDSYSSLVSALKAQIQQSMNNKQMEIDNLGQKYQPQRNQSEVQRGTDLRSILEQNANAGDRGGVGRQNALETQTSADNRINTIDLQQQNEMATLKNDISNLLLQGNIQEAQYKSQELKDLIANSQYVDETNYSRATTADNTGYSRLRDALGDTRYTDETAYKRGQDTFNNNIAAAGLTGLYNGQQTMQGRQADASYQGTLLNNKSQEITNKYAEQIAQGQIDGQTLQNEYQGLINKGYSAKAAADLAYQNAQTKKMQLDNEAQAALNKYAPQLAFSKLQEQQYNTAYAKAKSAGYDEELAATIAVKEAQRANYQNQSYNRDRNTTNTINKSTSKSPTYKYADDPNYKENYASIVSNPAKSLDSLTRYADQFINDYGVAGYNALYSKAKALVDAAAKSND